MIFAGISGAAVADAAGLGTIEMRAMRSAGYDIGFSASVTIASSTIGPIIPPSIMMVIYALTANVSIARIFVAGLLPGILIGAILMISVYLRVRFGRLHCPAPVPFSWARVGYTARGAILSLAASEASVSRGTLLLGVYAAGLGIPFLLAAMFITRAMTLMNRIKPHMKLIERIMGGLLVLVGLALLTGAFTTFSFWLLETFPILATVG
ncbi:hypothetical protein LCGC14_2754100, partial [marine sediment metagenome]